jgi:hypothetical protein
MVDMLATAHTWRGGDGPLSIAPLVGLLLTLLLIRTVMRLRVGFGAIGASVLLGALFATLGERWGYTVALSAWVGASALLAAILGAGPFPRNLSD